MPDSSYADKARELVRSQFLIVGRNWRIPAPIPIPIPIPFSSPSPVRGKLESRWLTKVGRRFIPWAELWAVQCVVSPSDSREIDQERGRVPQPASLWNSSINPWIFSIIISPLLSRATVHHPRKATSIMSMTDGIRAQIKNFCTDSIQNFHFFY